MQLYIYKVATVKEIPLTFYECQTKQWQFYQEKTWSSKRKLRLNKTKPNQNRSHTPSLAWQFHNKTMAIPQALA